MNKNEINEVKYNNFNKGDIHQAWVSLREITQSYGA